MTSPNFFNRKYKSFRIWTAL